MKCLDIVTDANPDRCSILFGVYANVVYGLICRWRGKASVLQLIECCVMM